MNFCEEKLQRRTGTRTECASGTQCAPARLKSRRKLPRMIAGLGPEEKKHEESRA